ncbi:MULTISPECIES: copper resistance protein B [unclassified Caulobacter]|uniref:copper resistance protein B n=1 Tax=unclassified Caulobacter TaxID=2648921 RepID=UPI0006F7C26C|nr:MULTISPECIES: copper resistance protein B [unclassified Caulobacter]KQV58545.1 copper resistance protein CopB [Caulobacter sp. Root342]KQV68946.1 copper resistance protein CopB [Caulobacter sp. Root343]
MKASLIALLPALWAAPAMAQHAGHHAAPPPSAQPAQASPKPAADPHAGHDMGAMPGMDAPSQAVQGAPPLPDHETAAPSPPADHLADKVYDPAAMDSARALLREEHGGARLSKVMANLVEYRAGSGADGYHWDGEAWFGGDLNRFVLKSEGEGDRHGVEAGEVQALYSRAVSLYTDLQVGVRQDVEPKSRTYATVGVQTLLPYWVQAGGALFLSNKGDVLGRAEGAIDWRLTQRLVLQPRAELNFAAQDTPETATGSGLSEGELGLRLRYEVRREFAPYVGVSWARRFGRTADYARAQGRDVLDTSFVVGVRAWF